ncbi:MAG: hypothetical protein SGARI_001793, partial [Bacillariaceae sp.]
MFHEPPAAATENLASGPNKRPLSQVPHHFDSCGKKGNDTEPPAAAISIPPSMSMQQNAGQDSITMVHTEESDEQSSLQSFKRKRRGSQGSSASASTKPKKKSKQDGRWSKRFTWPEDLHRDFVSAIFDVGLKQSSPTTILEQMPKHEQITTERIKSHLQKYRLHRAKSKKEFVSSYEASLRKLQNQEPVGGAANGIAGGEVAAHLTFAENVGSGSAGGPSAISHASPVAGPTSMNLPSAHIITGATQMNRPFPTMNSSPSNMVTPQEENASLMLPELTDLEKESPIGSAMGHLMGLFFSLRQQLLIQRSVEHGQAGAGVAHGSSDVPFQDVYGSFVTGSTAAAATAVAGSELSTDTMLHQQSIPSMRTNIEENSIMKREMQNQMALQNKMRALKEQELAKYKNIDPGPTHAFPEKMAPSDLYGSSDGYASKNA